MKVQLVQSVYFFLFSLYYTHYFVHYLRINLADRQDVPLLPGSRTHLETQSSQGYTWYNYPRNYPMNSDEPTSSALLAIVSG